MRNRQLADRDMMNKVKDRIYLLLTALFVSGLLVLYFVFIDHLFQQKWSTFILSSISYLLILTYGTFTTAQFKKQKKSKVLFIIGIYYSLTTGCAFLTFYLDILPMPLKGMTYVLPMTSLFFFLLMLLHYLEKNTKFFKKK